MSIKNFRNSVVVMLLLVAGSFAQSESGSTVAVSREYLNSSTKAFEEVVLLRTAVAAQQKALYAQDAQIKSQTQLITLATELAESRAQELKQKDEQIAIYKKMTCDKSIFLFIFKKVRCK